MVEDSATEMQRIAMMRGRTAEHVWLDVSPRNGATSFDDVALQAGLEPIGKAWEPIDRPAAIGLLERILQRDLAYGAEVMPAHRARWLAEWFVESFGRSDCRYGTNRSMAGRRLGSSWTPATSYTFDAGLAIVGPERTGIYWVADED